MAALVRRGPLIHRALKNLFAQRPDVDLLIE
jgi:hypothetical protein